MASDGDRRGFAGAIFDVDGVLVDSPHERAWREALLDLMATEWREEAARIGFTPERFTTGFYQAVMAGKPRMAGARAALERLGAGDAEGRALVYADLKQRRVAELIAAGDFTAFPDALRFVRAVKGLGLRLASASSSKNARPMLERIRLDGPAGPGPGDPGDPDAGPGQTLMDAFDGDVTGRDFARGKPDPMIFLEAARSIGVPPSACVVVEDAPSGIQAAKAGGMAGLGVARLGDEALLVEARADLVVSTLDAVDVGALAMGLLRRREEQPA